MNKPEESKDLYQEFLGFKKPNSNPKLSGWYGDGVSRPFPKTQVEDCLELSSLNLMRSGVLRRLDERLLTGELTGRTSIPLSITFESCPWYLRLRYNLKIIGSDQYINVDYSIPIQWEEKGRPKDNYIYFNPIFLCPGKEGESCGNKAYKLYLPPGEEKFLCRKCHNLAYRSEQDKTGVEIRKFFKAVGLL